MNQTNSVTPPSSGYVIIQKSVFETLYNIDIQPFIEQMPGPGGNKIDYLEWAVAWRLCKEKYPEAKWEIHEFEGLPYLKTECGYFVKGTVSVGEIKETDVYSLTQFEPSADEITNAHQRCLVKCLGRLGLGLKLWEKQEREKLKAPTPPQTRFVNAPTPTVPAPAKPGDYVCQVKKFKDKKLSDLKDFEILNYITWIKANVKSQFPEQKEFIKYGEEYLKTLNIKDPSEPPPVDDFDYQWENKK